MQNKDHYSFLITAGGTGGHVFPALALAQALQAQGHRVMFVTDKRFTSYDNPSFPVRYLHMLSSMGGWFDRIKLMLMLLFGYMRALPIIKEANPDMVIGFGGYTTFPVLLLASHKHIPIAFHEQNAVLGRLNKFFLKRAILVATSYPQVVGLESYEKKKIICTGNPVREVFLPLYKKPYTAPTAKGKIHILVIGGSQGAAAFSTLIPEALKMLPKKMRARIYVVQQARPEYVEQTRESFEKVGVDAAIESFFQDMPAQLEKAHLVIARAGASTIAEIATAGKPSILVPYPYAEDDHQAKNAASFVKQGAAIMMSQTGLESGKLAKQLEHLFTQPELLQAMADHAKALASPEATATLCKALIGAL